MNVFIGLFIYVLILGGILFYNKTNNTELIRQKKKMFLFFAFIPMLFVMGFRDISVGTDTKLYCYLYQINSKRSLIYLFTNIDNSFLYTMYNIIVGKIFPDPQTIIFTNSCLILFLTGRFIYKNSNHVVLSTILFIECYHFFFAFNISRQYIAIMLIANAFSYLSKNDIKKYIMVVLIASLFHATAIIMLIMVPLMFVKNEKKSTMEILYILLILLIFVFYDPLLNVFIKIFPHYSLYLNYASFSRNRKWILMAVYLVYSIFYWYLRKNKKIDVINDNDLMLLNIINIISGVIGFISLKIDVITRISYYFSIFFIIFIPKIIDKLQINKNKILVSFITISVFFIPMFVLLKENNSEVLPYINIFINGG